MVYEMIGQADTVGVFQIESRAQMAMLPRLRPREFYDLVIEVAIVRPGPIQGGMVHPYLRRRQGLEPVNYPSAAVREVLARTLGVPIFQEQVMQLAVVAAGFSPGEADRLRRAMAAWHRRGGLGPFERKLIDGMRARGYEEEFARAIFRQIEGFGEYGFPESHSASFALLAYVSAWLKRHEPAVFTCALLNSQPMGFYAPAQLVQDARRHGVEVRGVDVRYSEWDCRLEPGRNAEPALRLGFRMAKGLSEPSAARIVAARASRDAAVAGFSCVADLARRAGLSREDLRRLARAGALAPLAGHRHRAHWEAAGVEEPSALFPDPRFPEAAPLLRAPSEGEDLVADYRHLGLSLGRHPLALLRRRLDSLGLCRAADLRAAPNGQPAQAAGLVVSRQRPSTASGIIFMTLEDETGHINVVVRQKVSATPSPRSAGSPPARGPWRARTPGRGGAPDGAPARRPQSPARPARNPLAGFSLRLILPRQPHGRSMPRSSAPGARNVHPSLIRMGVASATSETTCPSCQFGPATLSSGGRRSYRGEPSLTSMGKVLPPLSTRKSIS